MSPERSGLNSQSVKFRQRDSFPLSQNREYEGSDNGEMPRNFTGGQMMNKFMEIKVSENEVGKLSNMLGEN